MSARGLTAANVLLFLPRIRAQPRSFSTLLQIDSKDPRYKLALPGGYPALGIELEPNGPGVKSIAGSMLTIDEDMSLTARCEGSCPNACCLGCCGESCCYNHYIAKPGAKKAKAMIAPINIGDIALWNIGPGSNVIVRGGAYLASDQDVNLACTCLGCSKCCATGTCVGVDVTGAGKLFFNAFGSIVRYDLLPGEMRKFQDGYVIGWVNDPDLDISPGCAADGCCGSLLIGEGIVAKVTNNSQRVQTVFVQTRSLSKFAEWLAPYIFAPPTGGGHKKPDDPNDPNNNNNNNNNNSGSGFRVGLGSGMARGLVGAAVKAAIK